jgi:hypothetical protein
LKPVNPDLRSNEQNKLMWSMLTDFANQVQWQVNGALVYMSPEDWKDVFTAALRKENRIALGIDGQSFVFLGMRTSKMNNEKMANLIDLMYAEGNQRGVEWTDEPAPA